MGGRHHPNCQPCRRQRGRANGPGCTTMTTTRGRRRTRTSSSSRRSTQRAGASRRRRERRRPHQQSQQRKQQQIQQQSPQQQIQQQSPEQQKQQPQTQQRRHAPQQQRTQHGSSTCQHIAQQQRRATTLNVSGVCVQAQAGGACAATQRGLAREPGRLGAPQPAQLTPTHCPPTPPPACWTADLDHTADVQLHACELAWEGGREAREAGRHASNPA